MSLMTQPVVRIIKKKLDSLILSILRSNNSSVTFFSGILILQVSHSKYKLALSYCHPPHEQSAELNYHDKSHCTVTYIDTHFKRELENP